MGGNLNSNNIEKDDFNVKTEDSIYKDLIVKLKEIKSIKELKIKTLAFDYPRHEPAYIKIDNQKFHISKSKWQKS